MKNMINIVVLNFYYFFFTSTTIFGMQPEAFEYDTDYDVETMQNSNLKFQFMKPPLWYNYLYRENNGNIYQIFNKEQKYEEDTLFEYHFFPYTFKYETTDIPLIYVSSISKINAKCLNLKTYLDTLKNAYKKELVETELFQDIKVMTLDGKEVMLKQYFGYSNILYVTFAYLEEKEHFITFALIVRNKRELEKYYNDFIGMINTYRVETYEAKPYSDYNYSNEFNYKELERYKKENRWNYLHYYVSEEYLNYAYKHNSLKMLDTFLNCAIMLSNPITEDVLKLKPPYEQEAYSIFKLLFNPKKLSDYRAPYYGHPEFEDENGEFYHGIEYFIIQDGFCITIYDTVNTKPRDFHRYKINGTDTCYYREISCYLVKNFNPDISIEGCKIILGSTKIDDDILRFLGYDPRNIPERPYEKSKEEIKKLEFLNKRLKIISGHWGYNYHIAAFPLINQISLNREMTEAYVYLRSIYTTYGIYMTKRNNLWQVIDKWIPFIE